MAQSLINMPSKPKVYLMVSPPIYIDGVYNISQKVVNDWFPIEIRNIAFELGIKDNVIDIFEALGGA